MRNDEGRERALENTLMTLQNMRERQFETDVGIRLLVKAALMHGGTWRAVGAALGTSGQAAWSKYRSEQPPKIKPGLGARRIE